MLLSLYGVAYCNIGALGRERPLKLNGNLNEKENVRKEALFGSRALNGLSHTGAKIKKMDDAK